MLKHEHNSEETTKAIKKLLKTQQQWLVSRLRKRVSVEVTSEHIGQNITWYIDKGIGSARDHPSGRKLRMDQMLFPEPVKLLFDHEVDGKKKEWTVEIEGTTRKVLGKIYDELKKNLDIKKMNLYFEGLYKLPCGGYVVDAH